MGKVNIVFKIEKIDKHTQRLLTCAFLVICLFMIFLTGVLNVTSFLETTVIGTENSVRESVAYSSDSVLLNLLTAAIGAAVLFLIKKSKLKINPAILTGVLFVWTAVLGILWVFAVKSSPTQDSFIVTDAAAAAARGEYSNLHEEYFLRFPFQLGYVLWSEVFIRLLHLENNFLALEVVNVLCLAATFALLAQTVRLLSDKESVFHSTVLLCMTCAPAILFCTFLYGNIPGLLFAVLAVYLIQLFLRRRKWYFCLAGAVCLGISVSLKMNFMIVLAALAIMLLLDVVCHRKLTSLVCLVLCAVCCIGIKAGVQASYEMRADCDFGDGIPMTSWMAMGLSDSARAPGWYTGKYTVTNFKENNFDSAAASADSAEVIKERISSFAQDPKRAASFFYRKFVSQWNDPTYQSIWTNEVRGFYGGKQARHAVAVWVCEDGKQTVTEVMNACQQIVLVGVLIAVILCFVRRNETAALLLLIILGGMLYHLLFEAKSQYSMTYYILMLPLAAWGWDAVLQTAETKISRFLNEKVIKKRKI